MKFLLPVLFAASSFATEETVLLKQLIQNKLSLESETADSVAVALQDSPCDALYCPQDSVPSVTIPSDGGVATGSVATCCPRKYLQCQLANPSQKVCRGIVQYTIEPSQGNNQEICPPSSNPDCSCQQQLAFPPDLNLKLCPAVKPCCPDCNCHGDPHCTAFKKQTKLWSVCDARDASCVRTQANCEASTYKGKACKWTANAQNVFGGSCDRDLSTETPQMIMYQKEYRNYFDPSDNRVYKFVTTLQLTSYGAISKVIIEDAGVTYNFGFVNGACKSDPKFPLNGANKAFVKNLPSGVKIGLQCYQGGGSRWDVNFLRDPWFPEAAIVVPPEFSGFCATGVIEEDTDNHGGLCSSIEKQIQTYLKYPRTQPIATSKTSWCNANFAKLFLGESRVVTRMKSLCNTFLKDPLNVNNWAVALCAISTADDPSKPADPRECADDTDCKKCVDAITDYPDEIGKILNGNNPPTAAPTRQCSATLVADGLARKSLTNGVSGIQVDVRNAQGGWDPVFALLDDDIIACGGCANTLFFNSSIAANAAMTNPGTYRIQQCVGLDTDPTQDLCTSSPSYNATVVYNNEAGAAQVFSKPFGVMVESGELVCSPIVYPNCPEDYICCQWDYATQQAAWNECMIGSYGNNYKTKYPQCGQ